MWPERPNYEAPVELNPGRRYEHGLCIVFREVFAWKVQIGSLKNQQNPVSRTQSDKPILLIMSQIILKNSRFQALEGRFWG